MPECLDKGMDSRGAVMGCGDFETSRLAGGLARRAEMASNAAGKSVV